MITGYLVGVSPMDGEVLLQSCCSSTCDLRKTVTTETPSPKDAEGVNSEPSEIPIEAHSRL